jgi:hypothetical protein
MVELLYRAIRLDMEEIQQLACFDTYVVFDTPLTTKMGDFGSVYRALTTPPPTSSPLRRRQI